MERPPIENIIRCTSPGSSIKKQWGFVNPELHADLRRWLDYTLFVEKELEATNAECERLAKRLKRHEPGKHEDLIDKIADHIEPVEEGDEWKHND